MMNKGEQTPLRTDGFIFTPHSPGCYLAEQGRAEYIVSRGHEWLDAIGRPGGSRLWHLYGCNCADCDSVVKVRYDVLMEWIGEHSGI
jgi:hypothetical protein